MTNNDKERAALDAIDWLDDFVARCNGDDRGSCESVNVIRRTLQAHTAPPVRHGLRVVEKPTCFALMHGREVVATLAGPDAEVNAARIAAMLAAPQPPQQGEQKAAMQRELAGWGTVRQSEKAIAIVYGSTYVTFSESEADKRMPWLVEFLTALLNGGRDE